MSNEKTTEFKNSNELQNLLNQKIVRAYLDKNPSANIENRLLALMENGYIDDSDGFSVDNELCAVKMLSIYWRDRILKYIKKRYIDDAELVTGPLLTTRNQKSLVFYFEEVLAKWIVYNLDNFEGELLKRFIEEDRRLKREIPDTDIQPDIPEDKTNEPVEFDDIVFRHKQIIEKTLQNRVEGNDEIIRTNEFKFDVEYINDILVEFARLEYHLNENDYYPITNNVRDTLQNMIVKKQYFKSLMYSIMALMTKFGMYREIDRAVLSSESDRITVWLNEETYSGKSQYSDNEIAELFVNRYRLLIDSLIK